MTFLLAATTEHGWRPGIGDPTIMGWVTVVGYFAVAWLCLRAAKTAAARTLPHVRPAIWYTLACIMAVLGVNKQLDLQSWFTQFGKQIARDQGWYDHRRALEMIFVVALTITLILATAILAWLTRRTWRHIGLAVAGVVFLLCFVLVRATSFHHVDILLSRTPLGIKMNWLLELGGIVCIGISAWRFRKSKSRLRR